MARNGANFHIKSLYQVGRLIQEDVLVYHYEGIHLKTRELLRIVQFKEEFQSPTLVRLLIKRAQALSEIRHSNLIELVDHHYDGRHVFVIYKQDVGSMPLAERIGRSKRPTFEEVWRWSLSLLDVFLTFEKHSLPAGITLRHLYVNEHNQLQVMFPTFHIEMLRECMPVLSGLEEAVCFPPELLHDGRFTLHSDVYMAGVLLYVLFSRHWPYENTIVLDEMRKQFLRGPYPFESAFPAAPKHLSQAILIAMANNPVNRFAGFKAFIGACHGEAAAFSSVSIEPSVSAPVVEEIRQELHKQTLQRTLIWIKRGLMALAVVVTIVTVQQIYQNFMMAIPDVEVPNVVGMTEKEALLVLESKKLEGQVGGDRYHPKFAKGRVIESKPPYALKVKLHRPVKIFISKGPMHIQAPYLVGRSVSQAKSLLQSNSDRLKVVEEVYSPTEEAGMILAQVPTPNSVLDDAEGLQVRVSKGFPISYKIEPLSQRLTNKNKQSSRMVIGFQILPEWLAMEITIVLHQGSRSDVLHKQNYEPGAQKALSFELDPGSEIEVLANDNSVLKAKVPDVP